MVRQELAGARALVETLTRVLEATGLGIAQLDARGRVVTLNDPAQRILKDGVIMSGLDRRLFVRNRRDNREIQRILGRALSPIGTQGVAGSAIVRRPNGLPPLVMHVISAGGRDKDKQSGPVAALVLIVDPLADAGIDPTLVEKALGLTKTEARVKVLLAQGKDVRAIAASTSCAESTIRFHVKRILAKLELTRQAALVRLVRSLSVIR